MHKHIIIEVFCLNCMMCLDTLANMSSVYDMELVLSNCLAFYASILFNEADDFPSKSFLEVFIEALLCFCRVSQYIHHQLNPFF